MRRYFIAAEPGVWNYVPAGKDLARGTPLPNKLTRKPTGAKLRYVEYTDETFRARVAQPPHLGLLGPVLRGTVGDFLVVTFLNKTNRPLSLHPHGAKYDKDSEGSYYLPSPGRGAAVAPKARFTYVWKLDDASGPRPEEPSSKAWLYHSHVNSDVEVNLGLIGFIVVTDPARARPDGTPRDVDRELAALFMIFDESGAPDDDDRPAGSPGADSLPALPPAEAMARRELGSRHTINGLTFGNLRGLEMNEGERVRWYLFALGSEQDIHSAHWHGARVVQDRRWTDVVELIPASMKVADLRADNPGSWLFHCHVSDHMMGGMYASYVIHRGRKAGKKNAFLGMPDARRSLRLGEPKGCVVPGSVTVYEAYAVNRQTIEVEVPGHKGALTLDDQGRAAARGFSFTIKNIADHGVVRGGLLEFELGYPCAAAGTLALTIGQVTHRAAIQATAR